MEFKSNNIPFLTSHNHNTPKTFGWYTIYNQTNGKFYVGSTTDLNRRRLRHLRDLEGKRHDNHRLQELFDHNPSVFVFTYEVCKDLEEARDEEQRVLSRFFSTNRLLNIALDARAATKGRKETPEQIEAKRQRLLGGKLSEETKRKISETLKGRPALPHIATMLRTINIGVSKKESTKKAMSYAKVNPVSINGVIYHNSRTAALELKLHPMTVHDRLKNKNYPTWFKINKE